MKNVRRTSKTHCRGCFTKKFKISRRRMPIIRHSPYNEIIKDWNE